MHLCISAFLHCVYFLQFNKLCIGICQNPLESIDWNPSRESGQESRNEIISDLSLAIEAVSLVVEAEAVNFIIAGVAGELLLLMRWLKLMLMYCCCC